MIKYCDEAYIVLFGQTPGKAVNYPLPSVFHFHEFTVLKRKVPLRHIENLNNL